MPAPAGLQVRIRAWDDGRVLIRAEPSNAQQAALWGMAPVEYSVRLPVGLGGIDATSAQALMTVQGQLYLRVNDG